MVSPQQKQFKCLNQLKIHLIKRETDCKVALFSTILYLNWGWVPEAFDFIESICNTRSFHSPYSRMFKSISVGWIVTDTITFTWVIHSAIDLSIRLFSILSPLLFPHCRFAFLCSLLCRVDILLIFYSQKPPLWAWYSMCSVMQIAGTIFAAKARSWSLYLS